MEHCLCSGVWVRTHSDKAGHWQWLQSLGLFKNYQINILCRLRDLKRAMPHSHGEMDEKITRYEVLSMALEERPWERLPCHYGVTVSRREMLDMVRKQPQCPSGTKWVSKMGRCKPDNSWRHGRHVHTATWNCSSKHCVEGKKVEKILYYINFQILCVLSLSYFFPPSLQMYNF